MDEPLDLDKDAQEAMAIAQAQAAQAQAATDLLKNEAAGKAEADKIRDTLTI